MGDIGTARARSLSRWCLEPSGAEIGLPPCLAGHGEACPRPGDRPGPERTDLTARRCGQLLGLGEEEKGGRGKTSDHGQEFNDREKRDFRVFAQALNGNCDVRSAAI